MKKHFRLRVPAVLVVLLSLMGAVLLVYSAVAERYSSTNYKIDASTLNTFGGTGGSTSYGLVSSGGEVVIGNGAGGSYKLGEGYVSQLDHSIQLAVQPTGIVAYYPMEEGAGKIVRDESGNENNGVTVNGPAWGTGKIGGALLFTGDADDKVVEVPDSASLSPTTAVTVMAWIYAPNMSADGLTHGIAAKMAHPGVADPPYELSLISKRIYFRTNTLADVVRQSYSPTDLSPSTWYHVVGTFDSTTDLQKIYINGALVRTTDTSANPGAMYDSTGLFHIGRQKSGYADRFFDGTIDHVKVFDRALTLGEIEAEYDAQNAGSEAGLTLGTVVAGTSNTSLFDTIVKTTTGSYSLAISQNANLTNGGATIPAVSGTIASPAAWSEGTTKGLGFTLVSGSGIPGGWGSGNNYAALPGSPTSFYTSSGYTAGTKNVLGMRLRLDTGFNQTVGDYTNIMTITGTTTP